MPALADYVVVGAGLTGATIARLLKDAGLDVAVVERREVVGGNCHDQMIDGFRVHTYGPHYFRTNSERIWLFVNRFADWYPFEARVMTQVDGKRENWPLQAEIIARECGDNPAMFYRPNPANFEEAVLNKLPLRIYRKYVHGYTLKQWGVEPCMLDASLAARFDVHHGDTRLKDSRYQALPRDGYTAMVTAMLDGIRVHLGAEYRPDKVVARRCVFFTGPIDEYFDFALGRLRYRSQERKLRKFALAAGWKSFFPVAQMNYPSLASPFLRSIEWGHLMENPPTGRTMITQEVPQDGGYEYPFPDASNRELYERYCRGVPDRVVFCGRLGEYRYLDMDQAIGRAMKLAERVIC